MPGHFFHHVLSGYRYHDHPVSYPETLHHQFHSAADRGDGERSDRYYIPGPGVFFPGFTPAGPDCHAADLDGDGNNHFVGWSGGDFCFKLFFVIVKTHRI